MTDAIVIVFVVGLAATAFVFVGLIIKDTIRVERESRARALEQTNLRKRREQDQREMRIRRLELELGIKETKP